MQERNFNFIIVCAVCAVTQKLIKLRDTQSDECQVPNMVTAQMLKCSNAQILECSNAQMACDNFPEARCKANP